MPVHESIARTGNLVAALDAAVEHHGDNVVERWKDQAGNYTHSRTLRGLRDLSRRFAQVLITEGVQANEGPAESLTKQYSVVPVLLEPHNLALAVERGTLISDAAIQSLYPEDTSNEVTQKVGELGARVLVIDNTRHLPGKPTQLEKHRTAIESLPSLRTVFVAGEVPEDLTHHQKIKFVSLEEALAENPGAESELDRRIKNIDPLSLARVIYTSGTTGTPKGAMLTHQALLQTGINALEALSHLSEDDRLAVYLPYAHVFGALVYDIIPTLLGGELWVSHKTTTKKDFPKIRPTVLIGVPKAWQQMISGLREGLDEKLPIVKKIRHYSPPTYNFLVRHVLRKPTLHAAGLDQVHTAIGGGGFHSSELERSLDLWLGKDTFYLGSGPTEASAAQSVGPHEHKKSGTAGKPIPGVNIQIVKWPDNIPPEEWHNHPIERICNPNEEGIIVFSSIGDMVGYWGDPKATKEVTFHDLKDRAGKRVFPPGTRCMTVRDVGSMDQEGYLRVQGRSGEMRKGSDGSFHNLNKIETNFLRGDGLICDAVIDFVDGQDGRNATAAIVSLDLVPTRYPSIGKQFGVKYDPDNPEEFYFHPNITRAFESEARARMSAMERLELPPCEQVELVLYTSPPTKENSRLSSTLKLRAPLIRSTFQEDLVSMLNQGESFGVSRK
ncbi:MAG: AMP-binding protein [Candidatus Pacearchaeota archaeon]|jgi:long-subunit acyl-CoA synthetase (AMP-forming)